MNAKSIKSRAATGWLLVGGCLLAAAVALAVTETGVTIPAVFSSRRTLSYGSNALLDAREEDEAAAYANGLYFFEGP